MHSRVAGFTVLAVAAMFAFVRGEEKETVAVMDFEGRGVPETEAATLADRFRSELSRTGSFDVMERAQMELILKEQAFQQTGCVDQSCAVEAGQLIAVNKIVTGAVSKVGAIYSVNVKMIDVGTGRIAKDLAEDCDCPIERVLTQTMRRIAAQLAGKEVEASAQGVSIRRGDASLFIKTDPESASVYLDGAMVDGRTPLNIDNLTAGKHEVRVTKGDYEAKTSVNLMAKKVERIELKLRKRKTVLRVLTRPSDAEVYIDGKPRVGKWPDHLTPALIDGFEEDTVRLTIFKVGYVMREVVRPVEHNRVNEFKIALKEAPVELMREQKTLVKKRKQRRVGWVLTVGGVGLLAGGTTTFLLARSDYAEAEDIKDRLDRSVVHTGPEYEALVQENQDKTDSGNTKSILSYALWGAGAVASTLGLVFVF